MSHIGVSIAAEGVEEPIGEPLSEEYLDSLASPEAQAMELPAVGIATLSWTPPTETLDGSPFNGIASYRIDYGLDPAVLERTIEIGNPGITRYTVEGLLPGVWYFRVTAFDADGNQSLRDADRSQSHRLNLRSFTSFTWGRSDEHKVTCNSEHDRRRLVVRWNPIRARRRRRRYTKLRDELAQLA